MGRWILLAVLLLPAIAVAQRNLTAATPAAPSEQRVALVMGNAAYQRGPLKNPVNDARAIAERLQRLGFQVIRRENLKAREIGGALREFRSRLSAGATALFFYAGHGIQVNGINYLPAVDAEIEAEDDVYTQALEVGKVLELMEQSKTRVNLVFLDACRDNPFARKFRSASRGLAKLDAPSGTLISFATRPGSVAADGDGRNGLYTEHLLKHIDAPGLEIEKVLKRVAEAVERASKGKQEPWSEGQIRGEFFFRPGAQMASAQQSAVSTDSSAVELAFWDSIKSSSNREDFSEYLKQFPDGRFAGLARNRMAALAPAAQPLAPAPAPTQASLPVASAVPTPVASPTRGPVAIRDLEGTWRSQESQFGEVRIRAGVLTADWYGKSAPIDPSTRAARFEHFCKEEQAKNLGMGLVWPASPARTLIHTLTVSEDGERIVQEGGACSFGGHPATYVRAR